MKMVLTVSLVVVSAYALHLRNRHRAMCREIGAHYMDAILE